MSNHRVFAPMYGLAILATVFGLASCNKQGVKSHGQAVGQANRAEVAPAELHHWLEHAELRTLMSRIELDRQKTVNTVAVGDGATLHPDAHKDYSAAAEAGKRLAIAAKEIPGAVADVQLTDEDRAAFKEQADAMRNEARKFSIIARRRKADMIGERMQALEATCVSCHTRFRDLAGEWQPPRA